MALTQKQKIFCREYVYDWNARRAYDKAFPAKRTDASTRALASKLLTNINIKEYIEEVQKDLEKLSQISKLKVLNEYQKIAFSSLADFHNTWINRKEFDQLTDEQKASIAEVFTRTRTDEDGVEFQEIRIKLHDKQKALESISKMLGYNEPDKVEHSGGIVWNETRTYDSDEKAD